MIEDVRGRPVRPLNSQPPASDDPDDRHLGYDWRPVVLLALMLGFVLGILALYR